MFQRILVPLDGSPGAERAIPVAARLARNVSGSLVFLHIIAPATALQSTVASPQHTSSPGSSPYESARAALQTKAVERVVIDTANYLATIPALYAEDLVGLPTEMDIAFGKVLLMLPSSAHLEHVDLIVLCRRQETGLGQWGLESIAQQVMRHSAVPLLILNEHAKEMPVLDGTHSLRILVPLDGSLFAETALLPVLQLLSQCTGSGQHELCLISVVHFFPDDSRGAEEVHTVQDQQSAEHYLQAIAHRLRGEPDYRQNIQISSLVTSGMDITDAILKQAEHISDVEHIAAAPLIAIATHGREGIQRQTLGSIAEHLLHATTIPLLVVCPRETRESD